MHHDAAHIQELSKKEMIEFYNHFILPTSPARSKLAVHLVAQGTAPEVASGVSDIVKKGMESLGINGEKNAETSKEVKIDNGTTPFLIKDVRELRARLQISAGPQAVKDISEFEELDSKL